MLLNNLSIVVPAKREAQNLEFIIPELKKYSSDIIVVDGHSNDGTEEICKKYNVRFILDNNLGKGDAQRVGAKEVRGENLIFFDSDGSHDHHDIGKIFYYLQDEKYDLVVTSRKTGGTYDITSNLNFSGFIRETGCGFLSLIFNKCFKTEYSEVLYSLKGFKTKKFLNLDTSENKFGIELEILALGVINKLKIIEIPSREKKRVYGKSKLSTITGIYFIYQIIKYFISQKKLKK